ncbi:MAG: iron complex transport system ATP-binding protein [Flavobacteriales bacterium]|jgi:iron complex transport system ATP-binding protein
MIKLENVELNIKQQSILKKISLQLDAGKLYCIIGANGAGKSSLLDVINREQKLTRGNIELFGKLLEQWDFETLAQMMATLPQQSYLNFPFRVEEVIELGRMPHSTSNEQNRAIVIELMKQLDIQHLAKRPYPELSGGEQQRVQLARVLSQVWQPKDGKAEQAILLLDEPSNSLDIQHQHQLLKQLRHWIKPSTLGLVVLHDFALVSRYADHVIALKDGEIYTQGTVESVLTANNLKNIFNIDCEVLKHPINGRPIVAV